MAAAIHEILQEAYSNLSVEYEATRIDRDRKLVHSLRDRLKRHFADTPNMAKGTSALMQKFLDQCEQIIATDLEFRKDAERKFVTRLITAFSAKNQDVLDEVRQEERLKQQWRQQARFFFVYHLGSLPTAKPPRGPCTDPGGNPKAPPRPSTFRMPALVICGTL